MRSRRLVIVGVVMVLLVAAWWLCFMGKPTAPAALGKKWHEQTYSLDEGEVVRLIPPPYSPQRAVELAKAVPGRLPPGLKGQIAFHANLGAFRPWTISAGPGSIDGGIGVSTNLSRREVEFPATWGFRAVDGDWFVNTETSIEQRMAALQSIFTTYTGREILLEKRMVEREVIVASGRWAFHPLEVGKGVILKQGEAVLDHRPVALFVDDNDLQNKSGAGGGSLRAFFQRLEEIVRLGVIDEVEGLKPRWVEYSNYITPRGPQNAGAAQDQFLRNLQKQTGLKFSRVKKAVPIWFVSERGATTQAAGGGK
jgi:hypothetical protein